METLTKYPAVAAGSALSGMLRYFLGSTALLARTAAPFPTATFVLFERRADRGGPAAAPPAERDIRDSTLGPPGV
jgi:hypothetical protein